MPKPGLSQWGLLKFMMGWAIPASDSCRTPFMAPYALQWHLRPHYFSR